MKTLFISIFSTLMITGCAVSAKEIETASYEVVKSVEDKKIQIRQYDAVVLVETPMKNDGRNSAFRRLFGYITGDNVKQSEIPMTAPVFMDGEQDKNAMMSFVLPATYTMKTAPLPTADNVTLGELKGYNVAAIRFSGTLSDSNVKKHKEILVKWMNENGYKATGEYRRAGYNAPFTLPWLRRNEVLIPVELK